MGKRRHRGSPREKMTAASSEAQDVRVMPRPCVQHTGCLNETCVSLDAAPRNTQRRINDTDASIRAAAGSGRPTVSGAVRPGNVVLNSGQPGQPDAHSSDAGGNRTNSGAPRTRMEAPLKKPPDSEWAEQIAKVNL